MENNNNTTNTTKAQAIWNNLIVSDMRLVRDDNGEVIGYICEQFYTMSDKEFDTFIEAYVNNEEE